MSIVSVDVVGETVAGVTDVWRNDKGRALAIGVSAFAALVAGIDCALFGTEAIHVATVAASIIIFGLACLAPYAPRARRPIRVPVRPDSEQAYLESLLLELRQEVIDLRSQTDERVSMLEVWRDDREQRLDGYFAVMADVSAEFSSAAERFRARARS